MEHKSLDYLNANELVAERTGEWGGLKILTDQANNFCIRFENIESTGESGPFVIFIFDFVNEHRDRERKTISVIGCVDSVISEYNGFDDLSQVIEKIHAKLKDAGWALPQIFDFSFFELM